jgi:hypothetical protein
MSEAYTRYQTAIESYLTRRREVQGEMEANRTAMGALLREFDRAAVEDVDLAPIQAKITRLDEEYDLLNRKALALANADKTEILSDLAKGVVRENSAALKRLRADYAAILGDLATCRREYLRLIEKAGEVFRSGRGLSNEIEAVSESVRSEGPIAYIPGVADDLNLDLMKGPIFFDNREVKHAFERRGQE